MEKQTFILTDAKYHSGICLNEYNDKISVCSAHEDENGDVYLDWVFPQKKDRKASDKSLPWKVELGDYSQAPGVLRRFADFIEKVGKTDEPTTPELVHSKPPDGKPGPLPNGDNVPF